MGEEQKVRTTIRNVPLSLLLAIQKYAKEHHRTQQDEILDTLQLVYGALANEIASIGGEKEQIGEKG